MIFNIYIYIFFFKNNIVNTFSKMHALIIENYTMEDQLLIGCPASEQISVLLSSMILSKKINTDGMSKEKIQN